MGTTLTDVCSDSAMNFKGRWRLAGLSFSDPSLALSCRRGRKCRAVSSLLLPLPVCLYLLRVSSLLFSSSPPRPPAFPALPSKFAQTRSDIFIPMLAYGRVATNMSEPREAWHQPRCLPSTRTLGIPSPRCMKRSIFST